MAKGPLQVAQFVKQDWHSLALLGYFPTGQLATQTLRSLKAVVAHAVQSVTAGPVQVAQRVLQLTQASVG